MDNSDEKTARNAGFDKALEMLRSNNELRSTFMAGKWDRNRALSWALGGLAHWAAI